MEQVQIEIRPTHGIAAPQFYHQGQLYAVVPDRGNYTLVMRNTSGRRVCVVLTVDGRNVITGQPGSQNDTGYVIEPHRDATIPGWKLAGGGAAAFEFTDTSAAYATQMGAGQNVGVIGAAVFHEKRTRQQFSYHESHNDEAYRSGTRCGDAAPTFGARPKSAMGPAAAADVGTGFGQRVGFSTTDTTFDRETAPAQVLTIAYRTLWWFQRHGIQVPGYSQGQGSPGGASAFPADQGATPPPGWRG